MTDLLRQFKKKFTIALLFWATGSYIAISVSSSMGEYTVFAATVLALFKASDVVDKHLNGGQYAD